MKIFNIFKDHIPDKNELDICNGPDAYDDLKKLSQLFDNIDNEHISESDLVVMFLNFVEYTKPNNKKSYCIISGLRPTLNVIAAYSVLFPMLADESNTGLSILDLEMDEGKADKVHDYLIKPFKEYDRGELIKRVVKIISECTNQPLEELE